MNQDEYREKLRIQAEKALRDINGNDVEDVRRQARKLIEELQIHQIELEMQYQELQQTQSALEESRKRFADLFNEAPVSYLIIDTKGFIKDINRTGTRLLQIDTTRAINRSIYNYIDPADHNHLFLALSGLRDTGRFIEFVARLKSLSATPNRYVLIEGSLVDSESEPGELFRIVLADVTETYQLKEKVKFQSHIQDHLFDAVIATDASAEFCITQWNRGAEKMYGWTAEEVAGKPSREILQTRFLHLNYDEGVRSVLERGSFEDIVIQRHKDGHDLYIEAHLTVLENEDGDSTGWVAINRDITGRVRADQDRLLREKAMENAQIGMIIARPDGTILYANPAIKAIWQTDNQFEPASIDQLFDAENGIDALAMNLTPGESRSDEIMGIRTDGSRFFASVNLSLFNALDQTCLLLSVMDISQRKQSEALIHQYTDRLSGLYDISRAILAASSIREIAAETLKILVKLIPCDLALVVEFSDTDRIIALWEDRKLITDPNESRYCRGLSIPHSVVRQTLQTGQNPSEALQPVFRKLLVEHNLHSWIAEPLLAGDSSYGLLFMADSNPDAFPSPQQEMISQTAATLAVGFRQSQLLEQTRQDAEIKNRLIQVMDHRVKNNLASIIGLLYTSRTRLTKRPEYTLQQFLKSLIGRIHCLSVVHSLLSQTGYKQIELLELIPEIVRITVDLNPKLIEPALHMNSRDIHLNPRNAHNIALIFHELVFNTLLHAGRSKRVIFIESQPGIPDKTRLIYRDNGVGYPATEITEVSGGTGLHLVQKLVASEFDGSVRLMNDNGAVCEMTLSNQQLYPEEDI